MEEESLVPSPTIELTEEFSDGLRWMSISGLMAESPEAPGNRIARKEDTRVSTEQFWNTNYPPPHCKCSSSRMMILSFRSVVVAPSYYVHYTIRILPYRQRDHCSMKLSPDKNT